MTQAHPSSDLRRSQDALRVLVVEDDADSAELLLVMLETNGCDVRVAHGAEEALAIARDFCPALALVDFSLQGTTGHELVLALRALPNCGPCQCVAVTGYSRQQIGPERLAAFDAHLLKPVSLVDVLRLVRDQQRSPA